MSFNIKFDLDGNPEEPVLVLSYRNGEKIGIINKTNFHYGGHLVSAHEISFTVYKNDVTDDIWNALDSFMLCWIKEWDRFFEIYVKKDDNDGLRKDVTGSSLGEAELSQTILYDVEINTKDDILRDDYVICPFYNPSDTANSIVTRVISKSAYTIGHVDESLWSEQRSFSFDNKTIKDAFDEISKEANCIFIYNNNTDPNTGGINRTVDIYDLDADRSEKAYGNDTNIFISNENLAKSITYTTDTNSVKNCFKLVAGDDLMNATIANSNIDGSSYLWYITDEMKRVMSSGLRDAIAVYEENYANMQIRRVYFSDEDPAKMLVIAALILAYNLTLNYYSGQEYSSSSTYAVGDIVTYSNTAYKNIYDIDTPEEWNPAHWSLLYGENHSAFNRVKMTDGAYSVDNFAALIKLFYDVIDLQGFLSDSMFPNYNIADITQGYVDEQAAIVENITNISVQSVSAISTINMANRAVNDMIRVVIDKRLKFEIVDDETESPSYASGTWTGKVRLTSPNDNTVTSTTGQMTIVFDENYVDFVKQKIEIMLSKDTGAVTSISELLRLDEAQFKAEIKMYASKQLSNIHSACEGALNILIEQGVTDSSDLLIGHRELYTDLYTPLRDRLSWVEAEQFQRDNHILAINKMYDIVANKKSDMQQEVDIRTALAPYWDEFLSYRREDTYQNDNYISDGLTNSELVDRAKQFIEDAKTEIYKSALQQHSISSDIHNLLAMKEFAGLVDMFALGNWLRIKLDGVVYQLRLTDFEIDFSDLTGINVEFSDLTFTPTGVSDIKSILDQATSMASSFGYAARQAERGSDANNILDGWMANGIPLSETEIINDGASKSLVWTKDGIVLRQYDSNTQTYSPNQLKILNTGIFITDDNWVTSRTAIGKVYYKDVDGIDKYYYGVSANKVFANSANNDYFVSINPGEIYPFKIERLGSYRQTDDTHPSSGKKYYTKTVTDTGDIYTETQISDDDDPHSLGLYEFVALYGRSRDVFSITDDGISTSGWGIYTDITNESGVYIESKWKNVKIFGANTDASPNAVSGIYLTQSNGYGNGSFVCDYESNGLTLKWSASSISNYVTGSLENVIINDDGKSSYSYLSVGAVKNFNTTPVIYTSVDINGYTGNGDFVSVTVDSDENTKQMELLSDNYENIIMNLIPVQYTHTGKYDEYVHTGFGAQMTSATLDGFGITNSGLVRYDSSRDMYSIAYSELHAMEVAIIQKIKHELDALKSDVDELKGDPVG